MRLLLDTNVLLWALTDSPRIENVRNLLLADDNDVFVSAVSWWKIAIKTRIGKFKADISELRLATRDSGFLELPLLGGHAEILTGINAFHNDPFDHMLLSQAMTEPMRLLSGDRMLRKYSSLVLLV
ncbi:MAG: type II toxin-antitoxin system VapC family toxin [Desulfobulbaceae bacterium]|jgi:PIN domain nuclease of toxin-antitoxin system|nr:type II toxin-antitoxin system VapC family toxin [Desulfobulbaceae bacterium]